MIMAPRKYNNLSRKVECSVNFFYEAQETNFLNNVAFQKTLVVLLEAVMDSF